MDATIRQIADYTLSVGYSDLPPEARTSMAKLELYAAQERLTGLYREMRQNESAQ